MTMILEVVHPDGTRTRHRIDGAPLTIGRALANDVILDDPYVDPTHARLSLDGDQLLIEDLGSVNGVVSRDERLFSPVIARPGDSVRLGRTTLRLRDPNESLPPALPDGPARSAAPAPRRTNLVGLATTTGGGLVLAAVTLTALGLNTWFGSSARSSAGDAVGDVLGYAALVAIWAGLWSIASRIILHQFRFFGHVAVVSALVFVALVWSVAESWLSFFFPDARLLTVLAFLFGLALIGALVIGHLGLASTMPRRRRWRAGAIVSGALLAITALVSFTKDDSFSDVPKFAGEVKPVAPAVIPTKSIDQFESMTQGLKTQVDQLAKK
jgi:hypothetical protein